jgi:hypothetical protein
MRGRFTQNYTWEQLHAFLSVFGPPRNLQPYYNIAPTDTVDVSRLDKHGRGSLCIDALGLGARLVEELAQGSAGDAQRARRIRSGQTDVPHRVQGAALHCAGERIFRMDWRERCEAAASLHRGRRFAPARLRRPLGPLERSPHRRMGSPLRNHRSGASVWIGPYHDRMPVLPEAKDFDGWLDGSLGLEVLKPAPEGALREWKVSPRLAGVGDDDPTIIEREA